jgi:tRNA nucleotidyltransferase (CCA-adding enzyme)
LQKFDLNTLLLAAAKCLPTHRRIIWQYLTKWQRIKAPLTGKDLQKLGYGAGKQMGEILQTLRSAAIDGLITTQEQAIAYLNQ